ncbi:hypothetical protein BC829DRAFT_42459 [Chytridium lagenaria]|nr:hypothetical protein BC829DRAFT_42459 [Chytridium lagenaria]
MGAVDNVIHPNRDNDRYNNSSSGLGNNNSSLGSGRNNEYNSGVVFTAGWSRRGHNTDLNSGRDNDYDRRNNSGQKGGIMGAVDNVIHPNRDNDRYDNSSSGLGSGNVTGRNNDIIGHNPDHSGGHHGSHHGLGSTALGAGALGGSAGALGHNSGRSNEYNSGSGLGGGNISGRDDYNSGSGLGGSNLSGRNDDYNNRNTGHKGGIMGAVDNVIHPNRDNDRYNNSGSGSWWRQQLWS